MQNDKPSWKRWLNPPSAAKGKNPYVAIICGLLLGSLGIALYFRSLAEFGWCVAIGFFLQAFTGLPDWAAFTIAPIVWGPFRVLYDNRQPAVAPASSTPVAVDTPTVVAA